MVTLCHLVFIFFCTLGDLSIFNGYIQLDRVSAEHEITAEILQKIRLQDRKTLSDIYKEVYPMVEKYILDNSGNGDDAQDIFQDAYYILIKKVEDVSFQLTSKLSTFLFGISKNLWLKKLTKKQLDKADYSNEIQSELISEDEELKLSKNKAMKKCIDLLGEPCKTIIVQFYFLQTSMKEIAEMLHYTNANNAKNQKYKCFVRLKKMMLKERDGE
ncbi:MAG: RNA polymerase sigma factor (sigma-70 family) [Arenicella sp.]|jgi:RNA polymerase sigma factor (sigma-70 family)